ncbi:Uncharacterised protein [Klebsiella pneumoniae subsp. pneumoniae]|uniref:Uncharacterized protein n=1 Tax=Klebsiella pneumoniae subsp. pneumoniae TaxID=72407 RepID=A0A378ANG9_KLEPN|nr:Uncharacterised protein [Klebsiella pneumoniae subsp. pneumoniae]
MGQIGAPLSLAGLSFSRLPALLQRAQQVRFIAVAQAGGQRLVFLRERMLFSV